MEGAVGRRGEGRDEILRRAALEMSLRGAIGKKSAGRDLDHVGARSHEGAAARLGCEGSLTLEERPEAEADGMFLIVDADHNTIALAEDQRHYRLTSVTELNADCFRLGNF